MTAVRHFWRRSRDWVSGYLANDDRLTAAANSGAFLVWGNQPFYPIYVWVLVGPDAWPSLLTWLSTPLFVAVPFVGRTNAVAGRALFTAAGIANTLLSTKAFGLNTNVVWFLLPCFILAVGFFQKQEWKISMGLALLTLVAGFLAFHLGMPLHRYSDDQAHSLSRLNLWSVGVLSLYLIYRALSARSHQSDSVKTPASAPSKPSSK